MWRIAVHCKKIFSWLVVFLKTYRGHVLTTIHNMFFLEKDKPSRLHHFWMIFGSSLAQFLTVLRLVNIISTIYNLVNTGK